MLEQFSDRQPLLWIYLFFLYFSLPYQILIYATGMSEAVGVRQAILMSTLWLIPVLLYPARAKIISLIAGVLLCLASLVAIGYFLIYRPDFCQSVIFIFFESNIAESTEFIRSYLKPGYLLIFLSF
jgi:heptose-I-phosphate ethanolaminephosphotransferase